MPYYGDSLPYFYGGAFSNHSSLMTGTPRVLHTPLSRFSPHLSTISESPLSSLRRYSPTVSTVATTPRVRRVIDTADIDVSTPRILAREAAPPRNRLKRDRPTIKIRCQALKDNPALREHHERHQKTVGELLVEKFLIKDKKEESERRLKIYHQVSLDRETPERQEEQPQQSKITRRFTRRRSSADIQLDPEQLQREVAYAQVQAEVLDNLVAEEQAEIENEVRQGTLIRKGTVSGARPMPSFYRSGVEQETMSQEEEEAAAQRMKKTLKKMKKKKKVSDKPPPSSQEDNNNEGRLTSDTDSKMEESTVSESEVEPESPKAQMFKIEASNSAGDFSTIWVNSPLLEKEKPEFEQFRESVKLAIPKKTREVEETEVVLPVRRPYVKDTSRNSVYFTVKPTSESPKDASPEFPKPFSTSNGIDVEKTIDQPIQTVSSTIEKKPATLKKVIDQEKPADQPVQTISPTIEKKPATSKKPKLIEQEKTPDQPIQTVSPTIEKKPVTSKKPNLIEQEKTADQSVLNVSPPIESEVKATISKKPATSPPKEQDIEKTLDQPASSVAAAIDDKDELKKNEVKGGFSKKPLIKLVKKLIEKPEAVKDPLKKPVKDPQVITKEPKEHPKSEPTPKQVSSEVSIEKSVEASTDWLQDDAKRSGLSIVTDSSAASRGTPSSTSKPLPKASKITPVETNTVEAAELSSREAVRAREESKGKEEEEEESKKKPRLQENTETPGTTATLKTSPSAFTKRNESRDEVQVSKESKESFAPKVTSETRSGKPEPPRTGIPEPKSPTTSRARKEDSEKLTKESRDEQKSSGGCEPKSSSKALPIAVKGECERNGNVEAAKPLKTKEEKSNAPKTPRQFSKEPKVLSPVAEEKLKPPEVKWKSKLPVKTEVSKQIKDSKKAEPVKKVLETLKVPSKSSEPKSAPVNESQLPTMSIGKSLEPIQTPSKKQENSRIIQTEETTTEDLGSLSKSTSTESIDFWSQIGSPASPQVSKTKLPFFPASSISEKMEHETGAEDKRKKVCDAKISEEAPTTEAVSNERIIVPNAPEELSEVEWVKNLDESPPESVESKEPSAKDPRNKKNLLVKIIPREANFSGKKTALNREDSATTTCVNSPEDTPVTSVPASGFSTPIVDVPVLLINIVEPPQFQSRDSQNPEEEAEGSATPTNEPVDSNLPRISSWCNQSDLSNLRDSEKEVTPLATRNASAQSSPSDSPGTSSKKKKIVKKKKSSTTKKSSSKASSKKSVKKKDDSKKDSSPKILIKPPDRKSSPKTSPRNTPQQRPVDLIRMFYTTPSALLTATPRDLSKVKRAKVKRRKRTPSVSSDSTGSTTSTATTGSSGSTSTELDDDAEHKRMNSTRSNDSGFDGSPRISNCDMACHKKCERLTGNLCGLNQKLVAEALQALKKAPSQSSDNQRNSDSSDHFPSGRITPPATNLPRFKKYAVTDFTFLKVLGKGSFGKVLLAELRGTECVYAVKCLKKDVVLEDDDVECTLIERKVLTLATRHPYLCHLFCTFQTESHLFFVMEYLNGGDLMFHIQKSGRFSETRARFYAAEIWSGLNFLHKKGIVYRDLKLDNVLLDFEGHIRIADFGMCKLQIFLDRTADTFCGTPDYMAPEIIKGLKYNQAVDWWSYGVLMYEMLTGQSPFSGCDEDELFWSICNERPFIPRYLSQESTDMLLCLLEKDSGKRLPGHDIALHPFFQSLPWDRLERRQLDPPFKPALDHTLDTRYFDTAFTTERPRLTAVPDTILSSIDQGVFRGFSYTNPNATD